ncbi:MAG: CoA transferase [Candidatus Binatia bacterium]|nr:CoA transferase [Candidatus Binatia bacterium]
MQAGALTGLKIVECSERFAGPFCTKVMADLGAEVIKIEKPGTGDVTRTYGPFPGDEPHPERSGTFLYLNTNKLGVTLDLTRPGGTELFRELIKDADILVETCPPGLLDRLGIGYRQLHAWCPRLIVTSITPFGQTGPYKEYKAYDLNCIHMGVVGYETPFNFVTDPENQPPLKIGGHQADLLAGWTAAAATMTAVLQRELTGVGQQVDIAEIEAVAHMVRPNFALYSHEPPDGPNRRRFLRRTKWGLAYVFPCRDGHVALLALTDQHWESLKELMGHPEWAESELFATLLGRFQNIDALEAGVAAWVSEQDRDELARRGQELHIPVFPVRDMREVVTATQYRERDFFVTVEHPETGPLTYPGAPFKFSATPWQIRSPAPRLGEHNAQIYGERLGLSAERIAQLRSDGVI